MLECNLIHLEVIYESSFEWNVVKQAATFILSSLNVNTSIDIGMLNNNDLLT